MGLHRAGFEVVGVDLHPQKNYPFEFHQADAMTYPFEGFDAYWASPPCQGYSIMNNLPWLRGREYPLLILPVLERLEEADKPYAIENVMGARHGSSGLTKRGLEAHGLKAGYLCGQMFGLPFYRHRLFATNFLWLAPGHPKHTQIIEPGRMTGNRAAAIVYSDAEDSRGLQSWPGRRGEQAGLAVRGNGAQKAGVGVGHAKGWRLAAEAMGIDWMKREELTQAIPPAYSEYIGRQLMEAI